MPSTTYRVRARIAVVSGVLALSCLAGTPVASAASSAQETGSSLGVRNWTSYIEGARVGFQSRRWEDNNYSEVIFRGCNSYFTPISDGHTDVELRQDINNLPDRSWGSKNFTACFDGGTSRGEWTGLASGNHFFEIIGINGLGSLGTLSVDHVTVDTTLGD
ncbi:hypothetical protein ACTWP5_02225 [Streptomyces sp. 4N509B]|uniref:hypothetical protein n=1 Tax=Streptomyces sp. 4N509B TaxID=3457413 RepID=UPI003FD5F378